jgi:serine protease Do
MIETERKSPAPGSTFRRPFARRLLAGTAVAALLVGGAFAGGQYLSPQPARADTATTSTGASGSQVMQPDFADLAQKVTPAVVSIRVREDASPIANSAETFNGTLPDLGDLPPQLRQFFQDMPNMQSPQQQGQQIALGSGFFISSDGYVVTNNHVVDHAKDFTVTTQDGNEYHAKLIGKDSKTDLALIKVTADKSFPFVKFASEPVRVGQWIMAVGNPFGLGGTVTAGIVSATGREIGSGPYDNYIQIDAPVNKGNSGGPTFDMNGNVIGINTAIYSPSGGSVGVAFDIPATTAQNVIASLKDHGEVVRGWLGVQIQRVTPQLADSVKLDKAQGALVTEPQHDSPAAKAGIKAGDTILAVNGDYVKDPTDLATKIAGYAPGTSVTLSVWRDGEKQDVKVDLGTIPGSKQQASADSNAQPTSLSGLGLSLAPSEDGHGVVVAKIDPNGTAADSGLSPGDEIVAVGGTKVTTPDEVEHQVAAARNDGRKAVRMLVQSGDTTRYIGLSFAAS